MRDGQLELWTSADEAKNVSAKFLTNLPTPVSAYHRGDGLILKVRTERFGDVSTPATELTKDFLEKYGPVLNRSQTYAAAYAIREAAADLPITKISPNVLTAWPPRAPDVAVLIEDEDTARAAWAEIARRAQPTSRLAMGLALMSPWVSVIGACDSALFYIYGAGGGGKTTLGRAIAALFASPSDDSPFLTKFDTTDNGLASMMQEFSYLPVVVDETQSSGGNVPLSMVKLVNGASRKRATIGGEYRRNDARWDGIAFMTSNKPSPVRGTHVRAADKIELFDRRLIEVTDAELWHVGFTDPNRGQWFAELHDLFTTGQGWPWRHVASQFAPGTPAASEVVTLWHSLTSPCPDNFGNLFRLAWLGCQLMRDWTGEDAWCSDDVWFRAAELGNRTLAQRTNPAREAAEALTDHRSAKGSEWPTSPNSDFSFDVTGVPAMTSIGPCGIPHPDFGCDYYDVQASRFWEIVPHDAARLSSTVFMRALAPEHHGELKARRPRASGFTKRARVFTLCMEGLLTLTDDDEVEPPAPPALPHPVTPVTPAPAPAPAAPVTPAPVTPAPSPAPAAPVEQAPAAPAESKRQIFQCDTDPEFGFTRDPDPATGLAAAAADGINDLAAPKTWTPEAVAAAGWDTHGWTGTGTGGWVVTKNTAEIRVRRHDDPGALAQALADFHDQTGETVGISVPAYTMRKLREWGDEEKTTAFRPKWRLPEADAEFYESIRTDLLHPVRWGLLPKEREDMTLTSYDRNFSYLPAIAQAVVAPLRLTRPGEPSDGYRRFDAATAPVETLGKWAGVWHIITPAWPHPALPSPIGSAPEGVEKWVTTEVMKGYAEWAITPVVLGAYLAPAHRVMPLNRLHDFIRGGVMDERAAADVYKEMYQSIAGKLTQQEDGRPRSILRPDWGMAIQDNSYVSNARRAWKVFKAHGLAPVALNVDALYYEGDVKPEQITPELPIGTGPGQYDLEEVKAARKAARRARLAAERGE